MACKQIRFIVQYTEVSVLTCSRNVPVVDMNFMSFYIVQSVN